MRGEEENSRTIGRVSVPIFVRNSQPTPFAMKDVVIVSAVRTPIGRFQGALSSIPAPELGGKVIQGALAKINLDPNLVQEVFMGSVLQANLGQAPARQAALAGGLILMLMSRMNG